MVLWGTLIQIIAPPVLRTRAIEIRKRKDKNVCFVELILELGSLDIITCI
jgi:hypothetical protein